MWADGMLLLRSTCPSCIALAIDSQNVQAIKIYAATALSPAACFLTSPGILFRPVLLLWTHATIGHSLYHVLANFSD